MATEFRTGWLAHHLSFAQHAEGLELIQCAVKTALEA
jgi:hypothetical protein